jgi:uncharacterized membrane protein YfcA
VLRFGADALSLALSVVFVCWGIWLLVTNDPDGGRHPAGVLLLTVGAVVGTWVAVAARRRWRQRSG